MRTKTMAVSIFPAILIGAMLTGGCGSLNPVRANFASLPGSTSGGSEQSSTTAPAASKSPTQVFGDAFKTVDKSPLNEDVQLVLWFAAANPETASPAQAASSALQKLVEKYQALVKDKGVHYTQVTSYMGMESSVEYWIKDGKFKKNEGGNVIVYDGKDYVKYNPAKKTGTRYSNDLMSADINITLEGLLSKLAASPYQQQKDAKYGKFDCTVFYMDMTVMGMKGSWLYVDKETGMLVNNQTGDPKDKKNSMSVFVTKFEAGGFGDDVFVVPGDVVVTDDQP
jgi:outer membrane lipoprotein-sorting protein